METDLRKILWREAATGGLYLGIALVLVMVIGYTGKFDIEYSWVTGGLNFAALVGFIYVYTKKVSIYYLTTGFSYPQSMGFIIKMMLFTGIIAGLGQFVLQNVVDPQYYNEIVETALYNSGLNDEQIEQAVSETSSMLKSPIIMIFSGALSMLVYGGLIGLVVSIFLRKAANPFAGQDNADEPAPTDNNQK